MRFVLSLALLLTVVPSAGCAAIRGKIDQMSDTELALKVNDGAEAAAHYGMKFLMDKYPDKKAAILKDAMLASTIIKANILPVFAGASSLDVLASAIETAMGQFKGKISAEVEAAIRLGFTVVSSQISVPKIPTDKLSPRLKGAILAFFSGTSEGLDTIAPPLVPGNP